MRSLIVCILLLGLFCSRLSADPVASSCPLFDLKQVWSTVANIPNQYKFTLSVLNPSEKIPDRASLHFRLNSGDINNFILISPSSDKSQRSFMTDNLELEPGAVLHSFVTYAYDQTVCDSSIYQTILPKSNNEAKLVTNHPSASSSAAKMLSAAEENSYYAAPTAKLNSPSHADAGLQEIDQGTVSAVCPSIQFDQRVEKLENNKYKLLFSKAKPTVALDWIDLHYKVNSENDWVNVRLGSDKMSSVASASADINNNNLNTNLQLNLPLNLESSDRLTYFFTMKAEDNNFACNSPMYSTLVSSVTHAT
jgi:hypothetical protein